jgi:hypothetical protein
MEMAYGLLGDEGDEVGWTTRIMRSFFLREHTTARRPVEALSMAREGSQRPHGWYKVEEQDAEDPPVSPGWA